MIDSYISMPMCKNNFSLWGCKSLHFYKYVTPIFTCATKQCVSRGIKYEDENSDSTND